MKKLLLFLSAILLGVFSLHAQTADTIENPGFERWEVPPGLPANHPEPVNWSGIKTSDNPTINAMAPVNWARSDTAHSGKYSVKLYNVSAFGQVATGTLTNGRVHTPSDMNPSGGYVYTDTTNPLWHTRFTARPDSLTGWFLCHPVSGDYGSILAILHTGYAQSPPANGDSSTWVGKALFYLPNKTVNQWTRFSVPFKYYSDKKPQYILFVLTSGNGTKAIAGSSAKFDDLGLVFNHATGIPQYKRGHLTVYAYNQKIHLGLTDAPGVIYKVRVLNILGIVQYTTTLQSGENKIIDVSLPSGIYLVQALNGSHAMVKKVLIR